MTTITDRVIRIQTKLNVKPDGVIGDETLSALERVLGVGVPVDRAPKHLGDPEKFFNSIRPTFGPFSASQVAGIEFLLGKMGEAGWPVGWVAYGLATAWHETAKRMEPVREGLDVSEEWRRKNLRYYPYYGRGYPQLTWDYNYRKAGEKLGLGEELVRNPDRLLEPEIAAAVMVRGMEEGWFTTKKLGDYLSETGPGETRQFVLARYIINKQDKAALIATYALNFQTGLQVGDWG